MKFKTRKFVLLFAVRKKNVYQVLVFDVKRNLCLKDKDMESETSAKTRLHYYMNNLAVRGVEARGSIYHNGIPIYRIGVYPVVKTVYVVR